MRKMHFHNNAENFSYQIYTKKTIDFWSMVFFYRDNSV